MPGGPTWTEISEFHQSRTKVMDESQIVRLQILHRAAHSGETFAEAEIVGRVALGRLALGPIPIPAVLEIDYVD